jgi:hypothetical protein
MWGKGLWGEKRGPVVTQVIERVKAHYEVHEVEFGVVYRWCPERAVCECGEKLVLTVSETACSECGAEHESLVEEVLEVRPEDQVDHPWRSLRSYYKPTRGT